MRGFILGLLYMMACGSGAFAQTDSSKLRTYELKAVAIPGKPQEAAFFHSASGLQVLELDSTLMQRYMHENLGQMLRRSGAMHINQYGHNLLATPNLRGSNAAHTAILWNGLQLQSPRDGLFDLSLFPAFFMENVAVEYGANTAFQGSGAMGGSIHLNNQAAFNTGTSIQKNNHFGSYGLRSQQFGIQHSGKKFITGLKVFRQSADNDFRYINTQRRGHPQERLQNSRSLQWGILQENQWLFKEKHRFALRIWHQENERYLPPNLSVRFADDFQADQSTRLAFNWDFIPNDRWRFQVNTGIFRDDLLFEVPSKNIYSYARSYNQQYQFQADHQLHKNHFVKAGITHFNQFATAGNYEVDRPDIQRLALWMHYAWQVKPEKLQLSLNIRQEWADAFSDIPFTPSLGLHYHAHQHLQLKAQVGRAFRVPTFNDLFWQGQGNPDLKPEQGWTQEASIISPWRLDNGIEIQYAATYFHKLINNWIYWVPDGGIFRPINATLVRSHGLENRFNFSIPLNPLWQIDGRMNYTIQESIHLEQVGEQASSVNQILMYTPMQFGNVHLGVHYKETQVFAEFNRTGLRYTSRDNRRYLDGFHTLNIGVAHLLNLSGHRIRISGEMTNITQEIFQVIPGYAMPLLQYQFGLNFTL